MDGVAIMAPESPQVRDAKARLAERGIETVALSSGQITAGIRGVCRHRQPRRGGHGRPVDGAVCGERVPGKVLVIAETMHARDSLERRLGFDEVINADYPHLTVLPSLETYGDPERTARIIGISFASHPDICGVYVLGSEARLPLADGGPARQDRAARDCRP